MSISESSQARLRGFLESIEDVPWLANLTEPCAEAVVCRNFTDAWDVWRRGDLWATHTRELETRAAESIGDESIDYVFEAVSGFIREPVWRAIGRYLEVHVEGDNVTDEGLSYDVLDDIQRDVSWAAIEAILQMRGFFNRLLAWYRRGRWPCGWKGDFPAGTIVVL